MQSHQNARFSKLSTTILWVASIAVLAWLFVSIKDSVQLPPSLQPDSPTASTTGQVPATTTAAASAQAVSTTSPSTTYSLGIGVPGGTIHAAIAATEAERERGLSGRQSLPKDSGMLFVFQSAGVYGFWMKDMNFPIDMVWIGADKKVSGVAPGVSTSSYPQIFYPQAPVLYVLELASGDAAKMQIAPGVKLVF